MNQLNILRAAHVELLVTDLEISKKFYVEMLGFFITEETKNQVYLRGIEERVHHSIVLTQSSVPAVGHLSFRVEDSSDLQQLHAFYVSKGCTVRFKGADEELGQGRALIVQDPLGFPIEFFAVMDEVDSYLQRYDLHRGAAVKRMDHFNIFAYDLGIASELWLNQLSFRLSEYVETDELPREKTALWTHRKPNVHDVAIMKGTGPRVHHIGFWMDDVNSIIRACDILASAGMHTAIERGPGRHGISNAFFLYLRDPDGHRIELYTGDYLTTDPDLKPIRWSATDARRQTLWGHATPESWWKEASRVVDITSQSLVDLQSTETVQAGHIK